MAGPAKTHSYRVLFPDTGPNTWLRPKGAWELVGTEAREVGLGGCACGDQGHRSPSPLGTHAGDSPAGRGQPEAPGEQMGRRHGRPVLHQVPQEQEPSAGRNHFPEAMVIRQRPESTVPLELGLGPGTACSSASLHPAWSVPGPVDFTGVGTPGPWSSCHTGPMDCRVGATGPDQEEM